MIPHTWIPHHRSRDDELVGYLVRQGDDVVPVTLFGYPLAAATEPAAAVQVLETHGLSVLADPWWLEQADGQSVRVRIREVSPDRIVVVSDDFGAGADLSEAIVLEVPEPGRLSR